MTKHPSTDPGALDPSTIGAAGETVVGGDLSPMLTDGERYRAAVLVRNARIRQRFRDLRATRRTVSAVLVLLSEDRTLGLTIESLRRIIYPVGTDEERPWLAVDVCLTSLRAGS